jgi:hypothetical protein
VKQFQELFSQHKYKEAADFAADSPQGILRTPETSQIPEHSCAARTDLTCGPVFWNSLEKGEVKCL